MKKAFQEMWASLYNEISDTDAHTPEERLEAIEDIEADLEGLKSDIESEIEERDSEKE